MKKIISVFLILALAITSITALAQNDITLTLNGKKIETDVAPQIVNDRTMVPVRAIFENLNITVEWSAATRKVYTVGSTPSIILTIDSNKMIVDDKIITLDSPPYISGDRTLIPARAVCEALGCTVDWDSENRNVIIKTSDYTEPPQYNEQLGDNPAYIENKPEYEKKLFELINAKRQQQGILALEYDSDLEAVAYMHSKDMAQNDYLDHVSPEGQTLSDRLNNAGVYYTIAAENIAAGFDSADKLLNAWINSRPHYENIINDNVSKVGIGCYKSADRGLYWTLVITD